MNHQTPIDVSRNLLLRVKKGEETEDLERKLAEFGKNELEDKLQTDDAKKAFWINIYNSYTQIILKSDPELYESRRKFFGADRIGIAGEKLSLDFIEHRLLRNSQTKIGLGYVGIPDFLVGDFEKRLRCNICDYRIHFALNCGAESCPAIATYNPEDIDQQLDISTASYLEQEAVYNGDGVVKVPRLLLWYRGDFGGKKGILQILRDFDIIPKDARPRLKHRDYNWELELGNYSESHNETDIRNS